MNKSKLYWLTLVIILTAFVSVAAQADEDDLMVKIYLVIIKSTMLPQVPWSDGAIAFTDRQACEDFGAMRVKTQRYTTDYFCRELHVFLGTDIYDITIAGNMGRDK